MSTNILSPEELHSLARLRVWPRLDMVPDEQIEKFRELGLVTEILGGQGWKPNDAGLRLILKPRRRRPQRVPDFHAAALGCAVAAHAHPQRSDNNAKLPAAAKGRTSARQAGGR